MIPPPTETSKTMAKIRLMQRGKKGTLNKYLTDAGIKTNEPITMRGDPCPRLRSEPCELLWITPPKGVHPTALDAITKAVDYQMDHGRQVAIYTVKDSEWWKQSKLQDLNKRRNLHTHLITTCGTQSDAQTCISGQLWSSMSFPTLTSQATCIHQNPLSKKQLEKVYATDESLREYLTPPSVAGRIVDIVDKMHTGPSALSCVRGVNPNGSEGSETTRPMRGRRGMCEGEGRCD